MTKKQEARIKELDTTIDDLKKRLLDKVIPKEPLNLFDDEEVINLSKHWIELNKGYAKNPSWQGGEEYYQGVMSGVEFVLFLMERMGD